MLDGVEFVSCKPESSYPNSQTSFVLPLWRHSLPCLDLWDRLEFSMFLHEPISLVTIVGPGLVLHPNGANHSKTNSRSSWLICRWGNRNPSLGFWDLRPEVGWCELCSCWAPCFCGVQNAGPEKYVDSQVREIMVGVCPGGPQILGLMVLKPRGIFALPYVICGPTEFSLGFRRISLVSITSNKYLSNNGPSSQTL